MFSALKFFSYYFLIELVLSGTIPPPEFEPLPLKPILNDSQSSLNEIQIPLVNLPDSGSGLDSLTDLQYFEENIHIHDEEIQDLDYLEFLGEPGSDNGMLFFLSKQAFLFDLAMA